MSTKKYKKGVKKQAQKQDYANLAQPCNDINGNAFEIEFSPIL
jgi:hypothetical protein